MKKVLVLGTFRRHPVPPEEIVQPVLKKIGEDGTAVEVEEHYIDGREGLDFGQEDYLGDAIKRAYQGLREVDFAKFDLVIANTTGFNPTGLVLAVSIGATQAEAVHIGGKCPEFWAVHFDRDQGYLPYSLKLYG